MEERNGRRKAIWNNPGYNVHNIQLKANYNDKKLIRRGSYMSAHVSLNLLNELGEKIRCEAVPSILSISSNEFNKLNSTGARMQDSIYHMTLKSHLIRDLCFKTSKV